MGGISMPLIIFSNSSYAQKKADFPPGIFGSLKKLVEINKNVYLRKNKSLFKNTKTLNELKKAKEIKRFKPDIHSRQHEWQKEKAYKKWYLPYKNREV